MVIYRFGIGFASIAVGLSNNLNVFWSSLAFIGAFAAIYHPMGIAMLLSKNQRTGFRLEINGVFGNMGVAAAPLVVGAILKYILRVSRLLLQSRAL